MASFEIKDDKTDEVLVAKQAAINVALEMIGIEAERYAKEYCPVITGRLRNSITHTQGGKETEFIGSNVEYAPYVEAGTSRRKPRRFLQRAVFDHMTTYKEIAENCLRDLQKF